MTMFKQTTEWKLFKTEIEIVTRLPPKQVRCANECLSGGQPESGRVEYVK